MLPPIAPSYPRIERKDFTCADVQRGLRQVDMRAYLKGATCRETAKKSAEKVRLINSRGFSDLFISEALRDDRWLQRFELELPPTRGILTLFATISTRTREITAIRDSDGVCHL